MLRMHYLPK